MRKKEKQKGFIIRTARLRLQAMLKEAGMGSSSQKIGGSRTKIKSIQKQRLKRINNNSDFAGMAEQTTSEAVTLEDARAFVDSI